MAWINHNNEKYFMTQWRLQCLNCSFIVEEVNPICNCGRIVIKNGRRFGEYFPYKDVSIWRNKFGSRLDQCIIDHFYAGKPTNPAPIPKPAPVRADAATLGAY